jgi:hypothetical protein
MQAAEELAPLVTAAELLLMLAAQRTQAAELEEM